MKRIDVLKEAYKLLKKHEEPGICFAIRRVFLNNGVTNDKIWDYFPLFTLENAKKFGARDKIFWWKKYKYGLFSGRQRFMRWLIKQYKNDKEEII